MGIIFVLWDEMKKCEEFGICHVRVNTTGVQYVLGTCTPGRSSCLGRSWDGRL
jgi:hypothetical protein